MGWPMQPCGAAPAVTSHVIPGGPGRPSGSHYGEPAIAGRHGRAECREILRIAGTFGNGPRPKIAAVERRRASARVLSANDTRSHAARADGFAACRLAVRIT